MQKFFLVSDTNSVNSINELLEENDESYVVEISRPNNKGEWLVVIDSDDDDDDY